MVTWNNGYFFWLSQRFEPFSDLYEFVWQSQVGKVAGNYHMVRLQPLQVLPEYIRNRRVMVHAPAKHPSHITKDSFVNDIRHADIFQICHVKVREVGNEYSLFRLIQRRGYVWFIFRHSVFLMKGLTAQTCIRRSSLQFTCGSSDRQDGND